MILNFLNVPLFQDVEYGIIPHKIESLHRAYDLINKGERGYGTVEQKYYSIRSILEERYLRVELVEKFDLDIDSLSGKTTLDKINYR